MPGPPTLPADLRTALQREMQVGEQVAWSAQPSGRRLWPLFGIYLFAVPWTAFSLFWESMALIPLLHGGWDAPHIGAGMSIVFPLFGVPFVVIGLGMMAAPFVAMGKAGRTIYALTNRRLITLTVGRTTKCTSVPVDRIGPISRSERADGWGSLAIQTHSKIDSDGDRRTESLNWTGIPDVARLEQLVLAAQAQPTAA